MNQNVSLLHEDCTINDDKCICMCIYVVVDVSYMVLSNVSRQLLLQDICHLSFLKNITDDGSFTFLLGFKN